MQRLNMACAQRPAFARPRPMMGYARAFSLGFCLSAFAGATAQTPTPSTPPATTPTAATAAAPATLAAASPAATKGSYKISIRATGQSNPEARSKEVWVEKIIGDKEISADKVFIPTKGWAVKEGSVYATGASDPLLFDGPLPGATAIVFASHQWTGIVEVSINGKAQTIDLYSPAANMATLKLDGSAVDIPKVVSTSAPPPTAPPSAPTAAPVAAAPLAPGQLSPPDVYNGLSVWLFSGGLLAVIAIGFVVVLLRRRRAGN
jgi:hypothetical protein